jgi:cytochrome c-type biogenesis protein CcmH
MRARLLLTLLGLLLAAGVASVEAQVAPMDSVALEAATRDLASQLRCPVCQGLSIQDSPSQLAQDMRRVIRDQLAEGRTPDEVRAHFIGAYGEWVLLRPQASGFNLAIYVLPVLALLAGGAMGAILARRWSRRSPGSDEQVEAVESDDPDLVSWDEFVSR